VGPAGRPDREGNGLALCVLHHKASGLAAFTLSPEGVLLVPDQAHGTAGFEEALLPHHGKGAQAPQRPEFSTSADQASGTAATAPARHATNPAPADEIIEPEQRA
jgi:hypothetical protein